MRAGSFVDRANEHQRYYTAAKNNRNVQEATKSRVITLHKTRENNYDAYIVQIRTVHCTNLLNSKT
jgi:thiamine kinase-like enzyme